MGFARDNLHGSGLRENIVSNINRRKVERGNELDSE